MKKRKFVVSVVFVISLLFVSVLSYAEKSKDPVKSSPAVKQKKILKKAEDMKTLSMDIQKLLGETGAVEFSQKKDHDAGIKNIVIGYDKKGKTIIAIAVRPTKTYKTINTLVAVQPDEEGYSFSSAEILNPKVLPGKSKKLSQEAVLDIRGKKVADAKAARKLVDTVTSATKYYKSIYISYGLMASKLIEIIEEDPGWDRFPLPILSE